LLRISLMRVRWPSPLERSQSRTCGSRRTLTDPLHRRAAAPDSQAALTSVAVSEKSRVPPRCPKAFGQPQGFAENNPPPAHSRNYERERSLIDAGSNLSGNDRSVPPTDGTPPTPLYLFSKPCR
jgi:hypothetical protein